jgi:hypothetical protein
MTIYGFVYRYNFVYPITYSVFNQIFNIYFIFVSYKIDAISSEHNGDDIKQLIDASDELAMEIRGLR